MGDSWLVGVWQYLKDGSVVEGLKVDSKFLKALLKFARVDGDLWRVAENGLVKVLMNLEEVHKVLSLLHDSLGHVGAPSILSWIKVRFWRKSLGSEVENYVSSCLPCKALL